MRKRVNNPRLENKNRTREIVSIGRQLYIARHYDFAIRVGINNRYGMYSYYEVD